MNTATETLIILGSVISVLCALLTYFLQFFYQLTITRRPLLHSNLVYLMRNQGFCWVITVTGMACVQLSMLFDVDLRETHSFIHGEQPYVTFQLMVVLGGSASGIAFTLVVAERCVAGIRIKTYERERHSFIIMTIIAITWIICIPTVHYLFWDLAKMPAFVGLLIVLICIVSTVYAINLWINNRRYYLAKAMLIPCTLSERFQLSENVRMAKLLLRGIGSAAFGCVISGFCLIMCINASEEMSDSFPMWRSGFYTSLLITSVLYNVAVCWSLPFWKETVISTLRRHEKTPVIRVGADNTEHLQTLEGAQIGFSVAIEAAMHFDQLRDSWAVRTLNTD